MYTLTDRLKNTRLGLERRVINNAADEQRRGVAWRGAAWRGVACIDAESDRYRHDSFRNLSFVAIVILDSGHC